MPVQVKQSWVICYDDKSWKVPEDFIKTLDDQPFVKLAGSNATLANFLLPGNEKFQKNLSLSMSAGFKSIIALRNAALNIEEPTENSLFGSPTKKPKKAKKIVAKESEIINLRIPDFEHSSGGEVAALSATHPLQDLWVKLDAEALDLCFRFMRSQGLEPNQKRSYSSEEAEEGKPKVVNMGNGRKAVRTVDDEGRVSYKYVSVEVES
jgi:hypothetical protein